MFITSTRRGIAPAVEIVSTAASWGCFPGARPSWNGPDRNTPAAFCSIARPGGTGRKSSGLRYEDLVADPQRALERLVPAIGEPPRRPIAEVVDANAIGRKKPDHEVWHFHYWQGQPGLWRALIPAAEALAIALDSSAI